MLARVLKCLGIAGALGVCLSCLRDLSAQAPGVPPVPKGVEVMARGPVHEAFATPTAEAEPAPPVAKKPPLPLEEMPPEEKPEGQVAWISGYWHWDDDRSDFLWVSGCWRAAPPGKEWVPGYWREQGEQWQWVPGFWTRAAAAQTEKGTDVTYYPAPPPPPQMAAPPPRPDENSFWIPGHWVWRGDRYAWQPGYYARVQPGYVWIPAHYRWTPYGHVYIEGYWDLAVAKRGILYAPVVVDTVVVGPRFVYVPAYAVPDTIVLEHMFVRPCYCHYYFGDYYEPRYRTIGYESCVVYSQRHYDSIVVYRSWEYRRDPTWINVQINIHNDRYAGRAPVPPRTLAQQTTIINRTVINNNTTIVNNNVTNVNVNKNVTNVTNVRNVSNTTQVLAPTSQVAAAQGMKTAPLAPAVRQQAALQARTVQQAAVQQRRQTERAVPGSPPAAPRTASIRTQAAHPVQSPASRPNPQPGAVTNNKGPAGPVKGPAQGGPQRPQTLQGNRPPAPPFQQRPPGPGAPAGAARPNGQRPPPGTAPPGAQRPAPTVGARPQPRPAPQPQGKGNPDDRKKKNNNN